MLPSVGSVDQVRTPLYALTLTLTLTLPFSLPLIPTSFVEVILNTNTTLYQDLEKELATYDPTKTRLGRVFLQMTAYLKVYTDYVSNYPTALTCAHELRERNKVFSDHCDRVMQVC
jgi:RhoGEF domain